MMGLGNLLQPPLNQEQIVARLAGATIAPAVINATGKISTTSTAADSIETAGGIRAAGRVSAPVVSPLTEGGAFRLAFTSGLIERDLILGRFDGIARDHRISADTAGQPGGNFVAFNIHNGALGVGNDIEVLRLIGNGTALITGSLPSPATSGQTNIGGGRIDTAERIISRSTAVDSIETAGGIRAAAGGIYSPNAAGGAVLNIGWAGTPATPSSVGMLIGSPNSGTGGKSGIFFERNANFTRGDLVLCVNGAADSTPATIADQAIRIDANRRSTFLGTLPAPSTAGQTNIGGGRIDTFESYRIAGTQVVSARGAAVADATDAATVITQLNALLARLRTHGLIAT